MIMAIIRKYCKTDYIKKSRYFYRLVFRPYCNPGQQHSFQSAKFKLFILDYLALLYKKDLLYKIQFENFLIVLYT